MHQYDYSTLNDKEAEEFVCDLLNAQFKMKLQSFKSGKDKGIDLRYATNSHKNSIIVQVKHYKNDFRTLFRNLKKEELSKVRKLKPEEYWLVTTLPLPSSNKDHILDLFAGFIPNTNYILGR